MLKKLFDKLRGAKVPELPAGAPLESEAPQEAAEEELPSVPFDFDAVVAQARETQSQELIESVWQEAFRLPEWHFIAQPPAEGEPVPEQPQPIFCTIDGQGWALLFTDLPHAQSFAAAQGLAGKDGAVYTMAMPVDVAMAQLEAWAQEGLCGVRYNEGPNGFFTPIAHLRPMRDHFGARIAAETGQMQAAGLDGVEIDFNWVVDDVKQLPPQEGWQRLWDTAFGMRHWLFLLKPDNLERHPSGDPRNDVLILEAEGQSWLFLFTDGAHAAHFCKANGFVNSDGTVPCLATSPAAAIDLINAYADAGIFGVRFNEGDHGWMIPAGDLHALHQGFTGRCAGGITEVC